MRLTLERGKVRVLRKVLAKDVQTFRYPLQMVDNYYDWVRGISLTLEGRARTTFFNKMGGQNENDVYRLFNLDRSTEGRKEIILRLQEVLFEVLDDCELVDTHHTIVRSFDEMMKEMKKDRVHLVWE